MRCLADGLFGVCARTAATNSPSQSWFKDFAKLDLSFLQLPGMCFPGFSLSSRNYAQAEEKAASMFDTLPKSSKLVWFHLLHPLSPVSFASHYLTICRRFQHHRMLTSWRLQCCTGHLSARRPFRCRFWVSLSLKLLLHCVHFQGL